MNYKEFINLKFPNLFKVVKQFKKKMSEVLAGRFSCLADSDGFTQYFEKYSFPKDGNIMQDLVGKFGSDGELAEIYSSTVDSLVHKWHHYIPIYEKYFEKYRGKEIRFLEIGVSKGGSLRMWREYLGPRAIIYGIDIDQDCIKYDGIHAKVRIGSQNDLDFLSSVVAEMGGIDVVLDDGSHKMKHIVTSMKTLFPKLNNGGTYMIEDLHTAYWRGFGGGYKSKNNFFKMIPNLADDMHSWYHSEGKKSILANSAISSIHLHDSIVVLENDIVYPPTHSRVGA